MSVSDWAVQIKYQLAALCALEMLPLMGSARFFYVICSGFLDVFHKFVGHTPGEAELLAVFAAYAADRLLPKHLRWRLSVTKNTTAQPVRMPISRDHMSPQRGFLRQ